MFKRDHEKTYAKKLQEEEIRLKQEKDMRDLRDKYKPEEPTVSKKMFQYSKILTSIILTITIMFNVYFYFYLVPLSGSLDMKDVAFETIGTILLAWNAGTVLFFMGYFAKALYETKLSEDNKLKKSMAGIGDVIEKVKEEIS